MSLLEILGFITGATCVLLQVRENIWNWPIGIANNIMFMVLFWQSKLYADAALQIFFMSISVYGWWKWRFGGKDHSTLAVSRTTRAMGLKLAAATVTAAAIIYFILRRFSDSDVPYGDATTTAISLTAQFMLGRKLIENWLLWIAVNVLYIGLYSYKRLYLTAFLYAIFIGMCIMGWKSWKKSAAADPLPRAV